MVSVLSIEDRINIVKMLDKSINDTFNACMIDLVGVVNIIQTFYLSERFQISTWPKGFG